MQLGLKGFHLIYSVIFIFLGSYDELVRRKYFLLFLILVDICTGLKDPDRAFLYLAISRLRLQELNGFVAPHLF